MVNKSEINLVVGTISCLYNIESKNIHRGQFGNEQGEREGAKVNRNTWKGGTLKHDSC